MGAHPVLHRRVDGVFRNMKFDTGIVVVSGQPPALLTHFIDGLPDAGDYLTNAVLGRAVRRND